MTATLIALVSLLGGFGLGWIVVGARRSGQLQALRAEHNAVERERVRLSNELAILRSRHETQQIERAAAEARLETLEQSKVQLAGTFAKLSQDTLQAAVEQLLQVVKPHLDGNSERINSTLDHKKLEIESLLTPVREMLDRYRGEVQASETCRTAGYAGLQEQIRSLLEATRATQLEASRLVSALKVPTVRGSWGENTLRNCVELAGMSGFCDFTPQPTTETDEGKRQRPDMIIRLPNNRVIAVDSKTPIEFYQAAAEEPDEERKRELLAHHARNVRRHVEQLSRKEYQSSVGDTLDFTVMFLGGEQFLASALTSDPSIFEFAAERKIFLATPTVLLPLLRAVAAGWRAEQSEENARQALALGIELYNRFVKVFEHIEGVGESLSGAVRKYNEAIRSLETKLLPKARQLQAFVSSSKDMPELKLIDRQALDSPAIPDVLLPIKQVEG
jgi:DNA recombination protein RmuC